jgi:hypothetical protein
MWRALSSIAVQQCGQVLCAGRSAIPHSCWLSPSAACCNLLPFLCCGACAAGVLHCLCGCVSLWGCGFGSVCWFLGDGCVLKGLVPFMARVVATRPPGGLLSLLAGALFALQRLHSPVLHHQGSQPKHMASLCHPSCMACLLGNRTDPPCVTRSYPQCLAGIRHPSCTVFWPQRHCVCDACLAMACQLASGTGVMGCMVHALVASADRASPWLAPEMTCLVAQWTCQAWLQWQVLQCHLPHAYEKAVRLPG